MTFALNPRTLFGTTLAALLLLSILALDLNSSRVHASPAPSAEMQADAASGQIQTQIIVGWFSILWEDDFSSGGVLPAHQATYIVDIESIDGQLQSGVARLLVDAETVLPDGPPAQLNRQRVRIEAQAATSVDGSANAIALWQALKIEALPLEGDVGGVSAVTIQETATGPQPWVIIRCGFPDRPTPTESGSEPGSTAYYEAMLNNPIGLDAYFNAISYGQINLNGSAVAPGWIELPENRTDYVLPDAPEQFDVIRAGVDCIEAADAQVNFAPFAGIGIVLNDDDCCRGGFRFLNLDGESRIWGVTYMDVDAPQLIWAHEMGHAFGFAHASGNGQEYNDPWSVMGASVCFSEEDPVIGCIGQHPAAEQKSTAPAWIPAEQIVTVPTGQSQTITLERLAQPATENPLLVRVPIKGSLTQYYTVEARQRIGFDTNLPGDAVVIHLVDREKNANLQVDLVGEPAQNSYYFPQGDDPTAWFPGRTFTDVDNDITIQVLSASASGYVIAIENGSVPLTGVTLSGPAQSLSNSVTFYADALPITASVPITYLWEASELEPLRVVDGNTTATELTWTTPGEKVVQVTASNQASQVVVSTTVTILGADLSLNSQSTVPQEVGVNELIAYTLDIVNEGPDAATDVTLSMALPGSNEVAFTQQGRTDFDEGSNDDVAYAPERDGLSLTLAGRNGGSGIYESAVIDVGDPLNWATIGWQPEFPSSKRLPDEAQRESGYPSGNADMTGNVLLLHLDEADNATRFANGASAGLAAAACAEASCPTAGVAGRYDSAVGFDGSQFIQVESSPRLNFSLDGYTQELWFYPTSASNSPQGLLGAGSGNNQYPSLYYEEGGIRFRFGYQGGSAWVQSANSIDINAWNHVAVTYDGTTLALYVNGAERYNDDAWAGRLPQSAPSGITLGRVNEQFFVGEIDEVALYRRALTAEEVTARYQRGMTAVAFQVRRCERADCRGSSYLGPDGTDNSFYTELENRTLAPPFFYLNQMEAAPFIQYRAILSTEDSALSPALQSVTVAPTFGVPTMGHCRGTTRLICDIPAVDVGGSAKVDVGYSAERGGVFTAAGVVQSATFDPVGFNNDFSSSLTIVDPEGTSNSDVYLPTILR